MLRFDDYSYNHAAMVDGKPCDANLSVIKINRHMHYTITFRRLGLQPMARGRSTRKDII